LSTTEEKAWEKITGHAPKLGRAGIIPIWEDDSWRILRNTETIWPFVENGADPTKVDKLRRNVHSLMEKYPETVPQLEKLGIRVKQLLNKPIKTPADVAAWATSFFNVGPVTADPIHVQDAKALAYDDLWIQVQGGRHPAFVIPAAPRGSGIMAVFDFNVPGSRNKYGPRHDFTKIAFSQQLPEATRNRTAATNGAVRPRGRPRKDGLPPGSRAAKAADAKKLKEAEKAKLQRERDRARGVKRTRAPKLATITELPQPEAPPARRVLARVGSSGVGS